MGALICWLWCHTWTFEGGHWVLPAKFAITKRRCSRCGLYQEVGHDHVNRMQFLEKEVRA